MFLDFQVWLPFAVGRSRHGLQYPYGSRQALPFLRPWLARPSRGDGRDHHSAALYRPSNPLDLAHSCPSRAGDVSPCRRPRRIDSRLVGRVLEPVDLADAPPHPAYWNFIWDSNPPTYYSSPSSSGSPWKSSTAEAAVDAGAAYPFEPSRNLVLSRPGLPNPDRQEGDNRA
jgi:hypothetical protein